MGFGLALRLFFFFKFFSLPLPMRGFLRGFMDSFEEVMVVRRGSTRELFALDIHPERCFFFSLLVVPPHTGWIHCSYKGGT